MDLGADTSITIDSGPPDLGFTPLHTYYVAPDGDDSRSASEAQNIETPWATFTNLSEAMVAGDLALVRGGTYRASGNNGAGTEFYLSGLHGTESNPIVVQSYPGEVPIVNYDHQVPDICYTWALAIVDVSHFHLNGHMIFTGLPQIADGCGIARGVLLQSSSDSIIENIEVSYMGGTGFVTENSHDVLYLNCDAHHNDDRLSDGGTDAWDNTDGFSSTGGDGSERITYTGCRAWLNSDDGWDTIVTNGVRTWNGCWAFWNGYYQDPDMESRAPAGNGEGFKLGCAADDSVLRTKIKFLNNCLAFENRDAGFDQNGTPTMLFQLYNCTAYNNGMGGGGYGFEFGYWEVSPGEAFTFMNNVSYNNSAGPLRYWGADTFNSHNTWNGGVTVNDADFQSVSSVGMDGPRQADGSLPNLPFMRLAAGSDLLNAGVDVGLPFTGSAPNMGCY